MSEAMDSVVAIGMSKSSQSEGESPPTKKRAIEPTTVDLFGMIGEDAHRHILSYLMCTRGVRVKHPKCASVFYASEFREEAVENNPGLNYIQISHLLENDFQALHHEEKAEWKEFETQDQERYRKEKDAVTTPYQLAELCTDLSVVSKHWHDVTADAMNMNAPYAVISPRDLFNIKSRVSKLSLWMVEDRFMEAARAKWGDVYFHRHEYDSDDEVARENAIEVHALDLFIQDYVYGEDDFICIVTREYVKFLVVKCVETVAANKMFAEETPKIAAWREECQPMSELVGMFWKAHMRDHVKYEEDVHTVIANLLDESNVRYNIGHQVDSDVENDRDGSDFPSKYNELFQFELQFGEPEFAELFTKSFDLLDVAETTWHEMQANNLLPVSCEYAEH